MVNQTLLSLNEAMPLIKEADVLLFRGGGFASRLIQRVGEGKYSHVGLATWHNGRKWKDGFPLLEITEFREWKGGRTTYLYNSYREYLKAGAVDVYRAAEPIKKLKFNPDTRQVESELLKLDEKGVTNHMRSMTGMPYGWKRIWWIARHNLALLRLFYYTPDVYNDSKQFDPELVYPVCSTAVAACFSKFGYDLVPNRADEWVEPNDIARSALLNYLFTIQVT